MFRRLTLRATLRATVTSATAASRKIASRRNVGSAMPSAQSGSAITQSPVVVR